MIMYMVSVHKARNCDCSLGRVVLQSLVDVSGPVDRSLYLRRSHVPNMHKPCSEKNVSIATFGNSLTKVATFLCILDVSMGTSSGYE